MTPAETVECPQCGGPHGWSGCQAYIEWKEKINRDKNKKAEESEEEDIHDSPRSVPDVKEEEIPDPVVPRKTVEEMIEETRIRQSIWAYNNNGGRDYTVILNGEPIVYRNGVRL